jgi:hypothetical protein
MSDDAAPMGEVTADVGADTGDTGGQQEQAQPSYEDRLNARLDEFAQQQQSQYEQLLSRFEQPEAEYDDDPYPLSEEDDGYEDQEAQRILDQMVNERVQQALTPYQKQQNIDRRDTAYERMVDQFPQMQDKDFASDIVQKAAEFAQQINPEFVDSPGFVDLIETFYKAHVADSRAQQETPAGGRRDVQLESGGGAAPADRDEDMEDRIIKAAQSASPRI